jgi:putative ABC transport system substrate-binding protein
MKRREFIVLAGAAAATQPFRARAQQNDPLPVIGYLSGRSSDAEAAMRTAFLSGLSEEGFVPGKNVNIEYLFAEGREAQLPHLADKLVQRRVALLVATNRSSALAAKSATATIPIVFTSGDDPARVGLVESLSKPGGNATGVSLFTTNLGPKRLGLLRALLPKPGLIGFIVDPNNETTLLQIDQLQAAANALVQPLLVLKAGTEHEVEQAFAQMMQNNAGAVLYGTTTFFQVLSDRLIALAEHYKLPACYEWRDAVVAGGLLSYNTDLDEAGRQIGRYAGKVLKGTKPADLPVVQSANFVLTINLKTAKALGLSIPPTLLATADEVIE